MATWAVEKNPYGGWHSIHYRNDLTDQVFDCGDLPGLDSGEALAWIVGPGEAQVGDVIYFQDGLVMQVMAPGRA